MGERGPLARRSDEPRLSHSKGKADYRNNVTIASHDFEVVIPTENPDWHQTAQWWYRSLRVSGQAQFYENSDWMSAYVAADLLDQMMTYGYSAGLMVAWNDIATRLMTTEGDRRRMRLELNRHGASDPDDLAADAEVSEWEGVLSGEVIVP